MTSRNGTFQDGNSIVTSYKCTQSSKAFEAQLPGNLIVADVQDLRVYLCSSYRSVFCCSAIQSIKGRQSHEPKHSEALVVYMRKHTFPNGHLQLGQL